jgi:predicted metalloprotease
MVRENVRPAAMHRRPWLLAAAAGTALLAAVSCSPRKPAPAKSASQQNLEILFRTMQAAWNHIFTTDGAGEYRMARIEIFDGEKETPCGRISSGLHYCAENRMISVHNGWLDGSQAPPPDVRAYLLARTLARHVQHQLTIDERVEKAIAANPRDKDSLLRKRELQTDCFVGLWRRFHEQSEPSADALKNAMRLAAQHGGEERPISLLEDRLLWFSRGLEANEIAACNIFAEPGRQP